MNKVYDMAKAISKMKTGASRVELELAAEVVKLTTELARIDKAASSLDRMACEAKTVADICDFIKAKIDRDNCKAGMKLMRNEGLEEILSALGAGAWRKP